MSVATLTKDNKKYKFNISIKDVVLPKEELIKTFKAIAELKIAAKKHKLNSDEHNFIKAKINELRNNIKTKYSYLLLEYSINLGMFKCARVYQNSITPHELRDFCFYFLDKLRETRSANKKLTETKREYLGFNYSTVANVFTKSGSILSLNNFENGMKRIQKDKKPSADCKHNYVGVELEIISLHDQRTMQEILVKAGLAGYVQVKSDGSIRPEVTKEKSHEIVILCQENNYHNVIKRVCDVLNKKEHGTYVNGSCGMHVHFDMRNKDPKRSYKNLFQILPLLNSMVPEERILGVGTERREGGYCKQNTYDDFDKTLAQGDRYLAINPQSFTKYKTIEVRLHSGTTNAAKIINWVTICLKAIAHAGLTQRISTVSEYCAIFDVSEKLRGYMTKRVERFTTQRKAMDTRMDHFIEEPLEIAI